MRTNRALWAALSLLLLAGGCYGAATKESCRQKYLKDRKGNDTRDTYEACLARAEMRESGLPEHMRELRDRVAFETGCERVSLTPLEYTGKLLTRVGANACGRKLVYSRALRRSLGMRTARNTHWELVADSAAPLPVAAPAIQVNVVNTASVNPYADD